MGWFRKKEEPQLNYESYVRKSIDMSFVHYANAMYRKYERTFRDIDRLSGAEKLQCMHDFFASGYIEFSASVIYMTEPEERKKMLAGMLKMLKECIVKAVEERQPPLAEEIDRKVPPVGKNPR